MKLFKTVGRKVIKSNYVKEKLHIKKAEQYDHYSALI